MFYGEFSNKSDVCKEFHISDFDGTVIYAAYDCESYEGSAEVVFVNNGKFFTVSGGHCSCYGLEEQWEPEEMPVEALRKIANDGVGRYADAVRSALACVEQLNVDWDNPDRVSIMLKMARS